MTKWITYLWLVLAYSVQVFAQSAPVLECVKEGEAEPTLNWSEPTDVCPNYTLWVSINGAPFQDVNPFTAGNTTTYNYAGADGISDVLSFYFSCDSDPSITSQTISNQRMIYPNIQSVSMVSNNTIQIDWDHSLSPNAAFYRVYEYVPGATLPTQRGNDLPYADGTSYQHTYAQNVTSQKSYVITALDACKENEDRPIFPTGYHSAIYMTLETDRCLSSLDINWTPYVGWNAIDHYEIVAYDQGTGDTRIDTVHADSTHYLLDQMEDNHYMDVQVRAVSDNGLYALSNDTTLQINVVNPPEFTYLAEVSPEENGVRLNYYVDNTADIMSFNIYRRQINGSFELIRNDGVPLPANVNPDDLDTRLSNYITFVDREAQWKKLGYQYIINPVDSCLQEYESNIGTSMLLEGNASYEYSNDMNWPHYVDWDNGVSEYEIYRRLDTTLAWELHGTTIDSIYSDDIEAETRDESTRDEDGIFCYRVKAKTDVTTRDQLYGLDTIESYSNELCLVQWPPFLSGMPNAFSPNGDGLNDSFRPNMAFLQSNGYSFTVYDRWGQVLFHTDKPGIGWDGKFHSLEGTGPGEYDMVQGMYVYQLKFSIPDPDQPSTLIPKELKSLFVMMR